MKTRFNLKNLKQHLAYNWWKYILCAVLIVFGTSLLFDTTRYQVPDNKKVEVYIYGYSAEEALQAYLDDVKAESFKDLEELSCSTIVPDEQYADMVLQVRLMAGEGDIYVFPRDQFINISSNGFLKELEGETELIELLDELELKVQTGWRAREEDTATHLFGIPISQLPTLQQYVYSEDGYMCVFLNNGNDEQVMKFLKVFLRDMAEPLPEAEENPGENAETVPAE